MAINSNTIIGIANYSKIIIYKNYLLCKILIYTNLVKLHISFFFF